MAYQLIGPEHALPEVELGDFHLPSGYFSFAQFRLEKTCGACYEARYVQRQPSPIGPPLVTGSAIHGALEVGRTALMAGLPVPPVAEIAEMAGEAFENAVKGLDRSGNEPANEPVLKLGARDRSWGEVKDKAISLATFTVPQVLAAEAAYRMLAVEAQIDMRGVFPFAFVAYADRMIDDPTWQTYGHIGDDKTSSDNKMPDQWVAWQLATYGLPWLIAGEPVGLGINKHVKTATPCLHLWTEPGYSFEPAPESSERLRQMVIASAARISSGHFEPTPQAWGCEYVHDRYPIFGIVVPELVAS